MTQVRRIFNHPARLLAAAAAALVAAACSDSTTNTQSPEVSAAISNYTAAQFDATAKPKFTTVGSASAFTSNTIPYWSSSFTDPTNGVTYPYTMVGTNPYTGSDQTTVPTAIIPFKFVFSNGIVLDGGGDVAATLASPIFTDYTYSLSGNDVTQYADAIQRAQFNKIRTSYHVRLADPTILPTQTISVPANLGFAFVGARGAIVGLMDIGWFSNQLQNAISSLHVSAQTVPIVLTRNTFLWIGNPNNCCVLGYHGATTSVNGSGSQAVQTYIYAAFITPRTFQNFDDPGAGLGDIHALSHEMSELYDDPFVNNLVNPWLTPTAPQYGCTAYLETGDPVVGIWFPLPGNTQINSNGVWHPEDEVYFSWFARQVPSIAFKRQYTYMDTFSGPAQGC
jgi:hypothetical protein